MPRNPINYDNTMFYKIVRRDLEIKDVYVGHTTDFKTRNNAHKNVCNNEKSKKYNIFLYKFIRENGGWNNWDMIMIHKQSCINQLEARSVERKYIETIGAKLSSQIPIRNQDEWKEYKKQYMELYCEENKDRKKEYNTSYYIANTNKIKEQTDIYRESHKDNMKAYQLISNEKNKEIIREKQKIYNEKNKEKIKEQRKLYNKNKRILKQQTLETKFNFTKNKIYLLTIYS